MVGYPAEPLGSRSYDEIPNHVAASVPKIESPDGSIKSDYRELSHLPTLPVPPSKTTAKEVVTCKSWVYLISCIRNGIARNRALLANLPTLTGGGNALMLKEVSMLRYVWEKNVEYCASLMALQAAETSFVGLLLRRLTHVMVGLRCKSLSVNQDCWNSEFRYVKGESKINMMTHMSLTIHVPSKRGASKYAGGATGRKHRRPSR